MVTTPVTARVIFTAFNVSPRDYALVFNANSFTLDLVPFSIAKGLPTIAILAGGNNLSSYNAATPPRYLSVNELASGADAGGTIFDGLDGLLDVTVAESAPGVPRAAAASVIGAATQAPDSGFFQLRLSAVRAFNQSP